VFAPDAFAVPAATTEEDEVLKEDNKTKNINECTYMSVHNFLDLLPREEPWPCRGKNSCEK
jgi:hypothetical protein